MILKLYEGDGIVCVEDGDSITKSMNFWIETLDEDGDIEVVIEI